MTIEQTIIYSTLMICGTLILLWWGSRVLTIVMGAVLTCCHATRNIWKKIDDKVGKCCAEIRELKIRDKKFSTHIRELEENLSAEQRCVVELRARFNKEEPGEECEWRVQVRPDANDLQVSTLCGIEVPVSINQWFYSKWEKIAVYCPCCTKKIRIVKEENHGD